MIEAVNGIQTLVLFGRHSDPNELRQRPEKGNEQITEKITLHITQLWGCYDDEGEKKILEEQ